MKNLFNKVSLKKIGDKGVALLIAISLLGVFALLGIYYVRDSETELQRTVLLLDEMKVKDYAKAGLNLALAELERAWRTDQIQDLLSRCPLEFDCPYYKQSYGINETLFLGPSDTIQVKIKAKIFDESGKINLNCSPASVLQKILNVDGETARQIVSNLPTSGMNSTNQRWIYLVDELYDRGWLKKEKTNMKALNFVSAWNAGNPENPQSYLNVNIAPPEVLMTLFNANLDDVQKIINARPFKSFNEVISTIGKDPSTFNVKVDGSSSTWQFPFIDRSTSFRVIVTSELSRVISGRNYNKIYASYEAGVVFIDGKPTIVWNKNIPSQKDNENNN
ncbi:MAG TPA: type II secretion system protein GspK [Candidatus Hydrogenedens sp.]|nr:type II secretion system protein GspK [Candidatus Hydrogenedens sp.]